MINRTRMVRQNVQRLLREDYNQRREQLRTLRERIATERARLTSIRSASAESAMIHDGGNVRQERDTAILVEIDRLTAEFELAKLEIKTIDRILESLDEQSRRIVEQMDVYHVKGAVERLCDEMGYERSRFYDLYDNALDKIAALYFAQRR